MWDLKVCRCCLATTGRLERISEVLKKTFYSITGLEIRDNDGYPQFLCAVCHHQLKKLLSFRRRSRRAFYVLKEIMDKKKMISKADVDKVDRKATNLEPLYSHWQPQANGCFFINHTEDTSDPNYSEQINDSDTEKNDPDEFVKEIELAKKKSMTILDTNITETQLTKYTASTIRWSSVIIDIKPDNYEELDMLEAKLEAEKLERQKAAEAVDDNDFNDDGFTDDVDLQELDMEDIFKDLEDPVDDDSDGISDHWEEFVKEEQKGVKRKAIEENPKPKWKKKKKETLQPVSLKMCKALANCTIQYLTKKEQMESYKTSLNSDAFKKAVYKCALCLIVFRDMETLVKHVTWHSEQLRKGSGYHCKICKSAFSSESELLFHSSSNHWYKFTCNICGRETFSIKGLFFCYHPDKVLISKTREKNENNFNESFEISLLHQKDLALTLMERGYGIQQCKKCGAEFNNKISYRNHLTQHERVWNYQCDTCGIWFRRCAKFLAHIRDWHTFMFKCKSCGQVCFNKFSAKQHLREHIAVEGSCPVCKKGFKVRHSLYVHINNVHPNYSKRFHCAVCGFAHSSEMQFYVHQLRTHNHIRINVPELGLPQYRCDQCNVHFLSARAVQTHMLMMGHEEAKNIPTTVACHTCKILFDDEASAKEHSKCRRKGRNSHGQVIVYPVPCCYCEDMLYSFRDYKRHFLEQHKGLPYRQLTESQLCEMCGKSVFSKGLACHQQTHANEEQSRKCSFCPAKPQSATKLAMHILFNHTFKPYHCAICGVRYQWKYECREHILKVHAPVTSYSCGECGRRFSHFDFLNEHTVKTHGINIKNNDVFLKRRHGKITVYPHMKIDGSLLNEDLLANVELELCDYLEDNETAIDYKECFLFNTEPLPTQIKIKKSGSKKKYKKKGDRRNSPKRIKTEIVDGRLVVKLNSKYTNEILRETAEKIEDSGSRKRLKPKKGIIKKEIDYSSSKVAVKRQLEEPNDTELKQALRHIEIERIYTNKLEISEVDLSSQAEYFEDTSELEISKVEKIDDTSNLEISEVELSNKVEFVDDTNNLEISEVELSNKVEFIDDTNKLEISEAEFVDDTSDVERSEVELKSVDNKVINEEVIEDQVVESDSEYVMIDDVLYKIVPADD